MTATQSGSNEAAPPLRLTDAVFGYDGRPATGPLNLVITGGEVVALLGANGSGKTTLVRGVLGLAEHHAGEVSLFGVPARRFKERWRIGYVPQRNSVAGTVPATVWEVVASGRLRRNRPFGLLTADDRAALRSALATSGLEGLEGRRVADLSGGQQRRVLIARALATRPELLILDEPTAGVDAERQELLAETLERLVRGGTTVLLVAHELGPAEPVITRTVVMTEGRLTYDGSPLPSHRHHDCGGEHLHLHGDTPDVSSLHIGSW